MDQEVNSPVVRLERTIPAPRHGVYRAWLDLELVPAARVRVGPSRNTATTRRALPRPRN